MNPCAADQSSESTTPPALRATPGTIAAFGDGARTAVSPHDDGPARVVRWRAVVGLLDDAGFTLQRQAPLPRGSMESHKAEWFAAGHLPSGDYVWIRVLHFAGILRSRWQVTAYRSMRSELTQRHLYEQHRILLHDPAPAEALAALTILGLTSRR